MNRNILKLASLPIVLSLLSGCAATHVAISKRNLDVQTKMSATLFLDPVEHEQLKKIYIQSKNTSDKPDFSISQDLENSLAAKGFKIVKRMSDANYILQVNILQVGKMDPSAAEASVYRGYGMEGVAIGAGATYVAGGSDKAMVAGGILGGLAAVVADSMVKDVHFSVITDVQIKERLIGKAKAENTSLHYNQSGTSGGTISRFSEKSDWKIYQTRILSSANKVNLELSQASPSLQQALVKSISNIF